MHRWRKWVPNWSETTSCQLIRNSLDWISDSRMTSLTRTCASHVFFQHFLTWRFLIPSSLVMTSLHNPSIIAVEINTLKLYFTCLWNFARSGSSEKELEGGGGRAVSSDISEGRVLQTNGIKSLLITTRIELNSKLQTLQTALKPVWSIQDVLELPTEYPF